MLTLALAGWKPFKVLTCQILTERDETGIHKCIWESSSPVNRLVKEKVKVVYISFCFPMWLISLLRVKFSLRSNPVSTKANKKASGWCQSKASGKGFKKLTTTHAKWRRWRQKWWVQKEWRKLYWSVVSKGCGVDPTPACNALKICFGSGTH